MKTKIYCKISSKGAHNFYISTDEGEYFLFSQNYRRGVNDYFKNGVNLNEVFNFARCKYDNAVIRTKSKLPMYIKYVEKEYGITILDKTKKKKSNYKYKERYCA